jgi:hypothetical protein
MVDSQQLLILSLFLSLSPHHEMNSFSLPHTPHHDVQSRHRPKSPCGIGGIAASQKQWDQLTMD